MPAYSFAGKTRPAIKLMQVAIGHIAGNMATNGIAHSCTDICAAISVAYWLGLFLTAFATAGRLMKYGLTLGRIR